MLIDTPLLTIHHHLPISLAIARFTVLGISPSLHPPSLPPSLPDGRARERGRHLVVFQRRGVSKITYTSNWSEPDPSARFPTRYLIHRERGIVWDRQVVWSAEVSAKPNTESHDFTYLIRSPAIRDKTKQNTREYTHVITLPQTRLQVRYCSVGKLVVGTIAQAFILFFLTFYRLRRFSQHGPLARAALGSTLRWGSFASLHKIAVLSISDTPP